MSLDVTISKSKTFHWIGWIGKLTLLILMAYVLYDQIMGRSDMDTLLSNFKDNFKGANTIYLWITVLLMPLNWLLESLKWRVLVLPWTYISKLQSLKAICAGIAVGIVTPARIGEYVGRYALVPAKNKSNSISATLVSSIAQNIVNIIAGYLGLLFFSFLYYPINRFAFIAISTFGLLGIILMLTVFYKMSELNLQMISKYRWGRWILKQAIVLTYYKTELLNQVLTLASLRYLVYMIQYVLFLYFFGINISWLAAITGVAVIFFVQSGIPLPPMLSVIARGELAIVVWSIFTDNIAGILAATFGLWVINLVLPALIGLLIVLNVKPLKSF